jgi:hypothetical protein
MTSPKWLSIGAASAIVVLSVTSPRPVMAQAPVVGQAVVITEPDNRAGPRIGIAYLTAGSETARNQQKSFSPLTSLFGWQFEYPFDFGPDVPLKVMTEFVVLVGGLEQSVPLPSATWLIGLRQPNGVEFGVGPTVNGTGTQLAFAVGVTNHYGSANVPINFAVAPARKGASLSVTAGFNLRR